jgi:hypothetical protein
MVEDIELTKPGCRGTANFSRNPDRINPMALKLKVSVTCFSCHFFRQFFQGVIRLLKNLWFTNPQCQSTGSLRNSFHQQSTHYIIFLQQLIFCFTDTQTDAYNGAASTTVGRGIPMDF